MSIRYKQLVHDGPRSMEHQTYLITRNAKGLSEAAVEMLDHFEEFRTSDQEKVWEGLKRQMQAMNRRIEETDVYMAGYHKGVEDGQS